MARPPATYIEAPPVTPLPFGLFSAALVTDDLTGTLQFGVNYQPTDCGPAWASVPACDPEPDFGTLSAAANNARLVTLTAADFPSANMVIDWGDGSALQAETDLDGVTHTYAADGDYTITVRDLSGRGYAATVTLTVTNGQVTASEDAAVGFSKVITDGLGTVEGHPFAAYSLLKCTPVGGVDLVARAQANLRSGEQRAAERFLAEVLAADTDAVLPAGTTAVTVKEGVAILEQWAAAVYGGVPTLHMPRGVASLMGDSLSIVSGRLVTNLGSLVAAGGGYAGLNGPTGTVPGVDEAWLYVTGLVTVRRSPDIDTTPMTMARHPAATNDALVLAERPYVVAYECIAGAVKVQSKAGQIGGLDPVTLDAG